MGDLEEVPSNSSAIIQPPPFAINGEDRSGVIMVITIFCLAAIWFVFALRAYIRLFVNKAWKLDDTCVAIATVLSTVRTGVVYLEVSRGYGKSAVLLSADSAESIGKAMFADVVLFLIALFVSKCAVLLLCQRMTPKQGHWYAIGAVFGVTVLWTLASVLLLSVKCSPGQPWEDVTSTCSNLSTRWKAISSIDIITEFMIFSCLIFLVWGLRMSLVLKGLVMLAFGIRLPTAVFSGIHLKSILLEITSTDPSLAGAVTLAWRQFELDFAIAACTFSSLGAFLKPFDKEMGPSTNDSQHIGSGHRFPISNSASGNHSRTEPKQSMSGSIDLPILRPDRGQTTAAVMSASSPSDRLSVESNDSKKGIIMKKQWMVEDASGRR